MIEYDCYIDGLVIKSIVRVDLEFIFFADGGSGIWLNTEAGEWIEIEDITDFEASFCYPESIGNKIEIFTTLLYQWQREHTPLIYVSYPSHCTLSDTHANTVIMPRRSV